MKRIFTSTLVVLVLDMAIMAQGDWNGQFQGDVYGTPSILTIQHKGSNLLGTINAGGYIYKLNGTVSGDEAHGKLTDSNTGGVMDFGSQKLSNRILILLEVPDMHGNTSQVELSFTRAGSSLSGPLSGSSEPSGRQSSPPESNIPRDQRLVGGWRYTDSYTSGEFSAVSEYYLQIASDGTYRYGDGKVMGGDAGSSFDSGQGGASTGQWKTENGVVYINEGYGWQPYASYIVDSNSMLFKFQDGSRQLWNRYR